MAMTFIDLKNVFGSISHQYIHDLLPYVKVPTEIRYYIHNLCSCSCLAMMLSIIVCKPQQ